VGVEVAVADGVCVMVGVLEAVGVFVGVSDGITKVLVTVKVAVMVGVAVSNSGLVGMGGSVFVAVNPQLGIVAVSASVGVTVGLFLIELPTPRTINPNR
jgi:hypothetical protein